jgi:hypothetical protein
MTTNLSADAFVGGTADASIFDYPILAPGTTLSVAYDPGSSLGLFQFTWDADVALSTVNSGNFVLSGEWWNGDPLGGGEFIDLAEDRTAPYSVAATPEPATLLLLASGLGILGVRKKFFMH